jgi:hypothetical protein
VNTINPSLVHFKLKNTNFVIYLHTDFYGNDSSIGTLSSAVPCSHRLSLFSTATNSVSFCYSPKETYITTKLTSTCWHILVLYIIITISYRQTTCVTTEQEALVYCAACKDPSKHRETLCGEVNYECLESHSLASMAHSVPVPLPEALLD